MQQGGVLSAQITNKRKVEVRFNDIFATGIAVVSYGGDGKYIPNVDVALDWSQLPESKEHFDTLISDNHHKALEEKESMDKYMATNPGRGWWPVAVVWWNGQHLEYGYATMEELNAAVMSGVCAAWVVCWYQLTDGSWIMQLWPVHFRSRL